MNGYPPLPASPMMLAHLLGLVFVVHVLFMNYVATGPLVAAWYLLIKGESGRQRARWMLGVMPAAFTFAINFGVAALLFVQALYAERFFTANIILGSAWLSVVGLLIAAFYGVYLAKRLTEVSQRSTRWAGLVCVGIVVLVWAVGIVMISNYFIATKQESWPALRSAPSSVAGSPSFLPRSLHFLAGSFAVTGFWMMWIAWWRSRRGENHYDIVKLFKQGATLAAGATAAQIVVGIWFVLTLSSDVWDHLFSGSFPSVVWMSGVAAGLLLLGSLLIVNFTLGRLFWLKISTVLLLYTLLGMAAGRDAVRLAAMGDAFKLHELPSHPQTGAIQLFLVLLLLGVATAGYLVWLVRKAPQVPE